MPSRRSLSVTSSRSIPAAASACRSAVGSSAAVGPVTPPCGAGGLQDRHRHRVDRVGGDQAPDVERRRVVRVLDARRRPQRALNRAAGGLQVGEALAVEDPLERLVGRAGVGQAGRAQQLRVAEPLEALVDLGVDPRDEERGDRVAVQRPAGLEAALHRSDVGLHHLLVGGDAEEQRDVDVQAVEQGLLDRRHALVGGRDLDHQVRAIDKVPVHAALFKRARGVVGEPRRDLPGHVAVDAGGRVVDRAQDVAGRLHVVQRHRAIDLAGGLALVGEGLELRVIVGGAEDRLLEDRGVRGHAAQRFLAHQPRELAGVDQTPIQLVEPDARACRCQSSEPLVHCGGAHFAFSFVSTGRRV